MPFAFLAPLFLAGALAIAIPIIVHLTHKQREDVQKFPSLMFVRQVPFKSTQKQRIRHWFLLMLRVLALILIAGAFARPFLDKPLPAEPPGTGARDVVILLDRSYSMGYAGRWEVAIKAARDALAGLGANDRATLVFFDERADAIRSQDGDYVPLRSALTEAHPGSRATRYAPAFRQALSTLQASERPRREVILISDMQKSGWSVREAVELPQDTKLDIIDVGKETADNYGVAGVNFARAEFSGKQRITVSARVVNRTDKPVTTPVSLELDGREAEKKDLTIPPGQAGSVQFAPFTLGQAELRGTIAAGTDALPADNRFHFVLTADQAITVSLVQGPSPQADAMLYIERALSAEGEPNFQVVTGGASLPENALRAGSVVIAQDATLDGTDAKRLKKFVENGGGLLIALGERGTWRGEAAELLPGRIGSIVDRDPATPGRVSNLQYGHRIFEAFRTPRAGDFTAARFYRYREISVDDANAVLARFDDGRAALVEKRLGRGRVLVWASSLDNLWNDVPLQPVFPPFIREAAAYLAGGAGDAAWKTAGDVLDATTLWAGTTNSDSRTVSVGAPSGERSELDRTSNFVGLDEQGFYQFRASGQDRARSVAVNVNFAESDLGRISAEEIQASVVRTAPAQAAGDSENTTPVEKERRQAVWWYLLLIAALLLAAESIISNRLSRIARA